MVASMIPWFVEFLDWLGKSIRNIFVSKSTYNAAPLRINKALSMKQNMGSLKLKKTLKVLPHS